MIGFGSIPTGQIPLSRSLVGRSAVSDASAYRHFNSVLQCWRQDSVGLDCDTWHRKRLVCLKINLKFNRY